LRRRSEIGKRVVVWGLMYGAELAVSLAREGKEVILIGEAGENTIASHASNSRRWWIMRKLTDINVVRANPEAKRVSNPEVLFHVRVEEITPEGVTITDNQGRTRVLSFDTLIVSRGREKNDALFQKLEGRVPEVYMIGDCAAAGNIQKAVWSANEVARNI
jgi:2-enoate reductase